MHIQIYGKYLHCNCLDLVARKTRKNEVVGMLRVEMVFKAAIFGRDDGGEVGRRGGCQGARLYE